jgi:hypothetical protein
MAIKLIGSILIMIGIVGIGLGILSGERFRLENLRILKRDINSMKSELLHNRSTFRTAIENQRSELAMVYREIVKGMENNNSVSSAWSYVFTNFKDKLSFNSEDIEDIKSLGKVFSSPDYSYQMSELDDFLQRIHNKINEAEENYNKKLKLCRSISTSVAVLVVVLLF